MLGSHAGFEPEEILSSDEAFRDAFRFGAQLICYITVYYLAQSPSNTLYPWVDRPPWTVQKKNPGLRHRGRGM